MAKRKGRGLTSEDLALWQRVAESTVPLRPSYNTPMQSEPVDDASQSKPTPAAEVFLKEFEVGQASRPKSSTASLAPTVVEGLGQAPLRMDKKAFTKLKRGKIVPEARIDLHGSTLAQAHPRLIRFVSGAHAEGKRLILVITGKGKSKPEPGPIPTRVGVLRHQVPQWLTLPPLNTFVLQVTPAHLRHGGEGAYYVYLRRAR